MFVPVDFSFPNTPGGAIAPPGEGQGGQMARCPPPVSAPDWVLNKDSIPIALNLFSEFLRVLGSQQLRKCASVRWADPGPEEPRPSLHH